MKYSPYHRVISIMFILMIYVLCYIQILLDELFLRQIKEVHFEHLVK